MRRLKNGFALEKFGIYTTDLPIQNVTVPTGKGQSTSAIGAEMHGNHPCVVLSVSEDGRSAIACPMTSALDSRGGEKYEYPKKEWLRIEEPLGEHDRRQLESRLKFLFGII